MTPTVDLAPRNDANRLGLLYRHEAARLPYVGPLWDVHQHIQDVAAAKLFFEVAELFGVEKVWTMTQLEHVDALKAQYGDRLNFIAVPNFNANRNDPEAFTSDWLHRLEGFREKGCRIAKIWAAPRGRDFAPGVFELDSPLRRRGIQLAYELDMMFMTHVSDPDTWFATKYADSGKYGTKAQQYEPLHRLLDQYGDVPWIAAHMGGDPEHLDHLQAMLDRHPNLYLDTSATKWMVRELSRKPDELRDFARRNAGRLLFGSDIVADSKDAGFDLFASRYWALRTMFETDYDGLSPIVDPDLAMVDPSLPKDSVANLRGASIDPATLAMIYKDAAQRLLSEWM